MNHVYVYYYLFLDSSIKFIIYITYDGRTKYILFYHTPNLRYVIFESCFCILNNEPDVILATDALMVFATHGFNAGYHIGMR